MDDALNFAFVRDFLVLRNTPALIGSSNLQNNFCVIQRNKSFEGYVDGVFSGNFSYIVPNQFNLCSGVALTRILVIYYPIME